MARPARLELAASCSGGFPEQLPYTAGNRQLLPNQWVVLKLNCHKLPLNAAICQTFLHPCYTRNVTVSVAFLYPWMNFYRSLVTEKHTITCHPYKVWLVYKAVTFVVETFTWWPLWRYICFVHDIRCSRGIANNLFSGCTSSRMRTFFNNNSDFT